jgi:HPt (histidine-containing phosphotransfer) domain-containing protein
MSADTGDVVEVEAWLVHLVPRFLANRLKDVVLLGAAVRTRDLEAIRVIGHNLKGGAGGYGFPALAVIGARLEAAAEAGSFDLAAECADELDRYVRTVKVVYR